MNACMVLNPVGGVLAAGGAGEEVGMQMLALGLIVLAAHLGGRVCRRLHVAEVMGQLLGGVLVGPYALSMMGLIGSGGLYNEAFGTFRFFVFAFLAIVAFGIGEELHVNRLKKVGRSTLVICLIQALLTWLIIASSFYLATRLAVPALGIDPERLPLLQCLLLGTMGIATAPAVTFVLMNQLRIEGRLRHILGSLTVLDDLIEVLIFSLLLQTSLAHQRHMAGAAPGSAVWEIGWPVLVEVAAAAALGLLAYVGLKALVRRKQPALIDSETENEINGQASNVAFLRSVLAEPSSSSVEVLVVVWGLIAIASGVAYMHHWPFLITAMLAGFLVANWHAHSLFVFDALKIGPITRVLNLGFFALIGASISLGELTAGTAWLAGIYIVARMIGKIGGTWLGCKVMREDPKITRCLPTLMLPQAGVAAVEAVYASAVLNDPFFAAIVLPAVVFFEVVGVYLVERSLRNWRSSSAGQAADEERRIANGPTEAAKWLQPYVSRQFVHFKLSGTTKDEILTELVDHAVANSGQYISRSQALQVLSERELVAPTGFGNGVAIPHGRLMGLDHPVLVFARHRSGVNFGDMDNMPCDLFVMLLTCARNPDEHVRLLSALAQIFGDERVLARLRKARNEKAFLRALVELAHADDGAADA